MSEKWKYQENSGIGNRKKFKRLIFPEKFARHRLEKLLARTIKIYGFFCRNLHPSSRDFSSKRYHCQLKITPGGFKYLSNFFWMRKKLPKIGQLLISFRQNFRNSNGSPAPLSIEFFSKSANCFKTSEICQLWTKFHSNLVRRTVFIRFLKWTFCGKMSSLLVWRVLLWGAPKKHQDVWIRL